MASRVPEPGPGDDLHIERRVSRADRILRNPMREGCAEPRLRPLERHKNSEKYVRQTNDRAAEDAVGPGPTKWEADMTAKLISSTVVTVLSADQHA